MVSSISIILYVKEKTREQKEAELIPKVQEAVNYGLKVLESAFEQLDIKAGNSDSEDEETLEKVEPILEAKVNASLQSLSTYLIIRQLLYIISGFGLVVLKCAKKTQIERGNRAMSTSSLLFVPKCMLIGRTCMWTGLCRTWLVPKHLWIRRMLAWAICPAMVRFQIHNLYDFLRLF